MVISGACNEEFSAFCLVCSGAWGVEGWPRRPQLDTGLCAPSPPCPAAPSSLRTRCTPRRCFSLRVHGEGEITWTS